MAAESPHRPVETKDGSTVWMKDSSEATEAQQGDAARNSEASVS
jgi:hypothetical protein